jgi:hypothetical protein
LPRVYYIDAGHAGRSGQVWLALADAVARDEAEVLACQTQHPIARASAPLLHAGRTVLSSHTHHRRA